MTDPAPTMDYLDALEGQSLFILREVAANFRRPLMLYSVGKDSSVLMHLLQKAFAPAKPPIELLHVDTTWKFREMIEFRDQRATETGLTVHVRTNQDGVAQGITPVTHDATTYTDVMKTQALKQALAEFQVDAAIGGARRDEEKSRAKERVFSFRNDAQSWNPREQRPELWDVFNTRIAPGESMRVFPVSNWTELDVWEYIARENIPVTDLYFAKERPVVQRQGTWIMVDDERLQLHDGEKVEMRKVRFRTLGCYPLTGAMESDATSVEEIISEMRASRFSERQGRLIDGDAAASMERKKKDGYF